MDRQEPTIAAALQNVINTYARRGFNIDLVRGDPEFECLQKHMPNVQFDFAAQGDHVHDIERYVRTVKDRVRSCYNCLPFSHVPKAAINRMVRNAVFWLNAIPHQDGVSDTLSPR